MNGSASKLDTERMSPDSVMRESSRKSVNHELEAEVIIEAFNRFEVDYVVIGAFAYSSGFWVS